MLHLCLKKLTPSFNQDCIHIRKCLMPSMREHYNTDGIRISTTAISFFLHHLPHYSTCFGCFFCAFMGENWKCGMRRKLGDWWHLSWIFLCPFFRNNAAHFSQFQFGLYSPICRIRLHFHHMFWSYKDNQCSGRGIYRIKIWDYSHSESGRSPSLSSRYFTICPANSIPCRLCRTPPSSFCTVSPTFLADHTWS